MIGIGEAMSTVVRNWWTTASTNPMPTRSVRMLIDRRQATTLALACWNSPSLITLWSRRSASWAFSAGLAPLEVLSS